MIIVGSGLDEVIQLLHRVLLRPGDAILDCPPSFEAYQAEARLSPLQLSFLSESRRLDNTRMKRELRLTLRYRTVDAALAALTPPASA